MNRLNRQRNGKKCNDKNISHDGIDLQELNYRHGNGRRGEQSNHATVKKAME